MKIFIQSFPDKLITLEVQPTDTVANVKTGIQDKEGHPPESQRLIFAGKELKDDDATLKECHITKEETIHLELRAPTQTTTVFVTMLDDTHEQISVDVNMSDTVRMVKRKIQEQRSITMSRQRLWIGETELKDDQKFSDAQFEYKSKVFLSLDPGTMPWWQKCCCCRRS